MGITSALLVPNMGSVTGTLGPTHGGTGVATYTLGDTLYSSAANTLAKLSGNTAAAKRLLSQTGDGVNSAAPSWSALVAGDIPNLPASIITSGQIALAQLGSGTPAAGKYVDGATGAWTALSAGGADSLSTLTAGTLSASVPLNLGTNAIVFNGIGSVPASTVSYIVGDAANGNVIVNVPSAKSYSANVAGVTKFTVDGTYLTTPNILKFSGGAGNVGYITSDSTGLLFVNNALTKIFLNWVESGTTLTLSDGNSGESSVVCSPTEAALVYGTTARVSVGSTAVTMSGGQINNTIVTKTTTYTLTTSDYIVFGGHATVAFTLTLPAATGSNRIYIIKNINVAVVTVQANGAELIDASNTQALALNASITIIDYAPGYWGII